MKRNKGFTLVEVIAVIAVLGIIILIAVPNIDGLLRSSKKETEKEQLRELYRAAEMYVSDKLISLNIGEVKAIPVAELMAESYISSIPKNPVNKKKMDGIIEVKATSTNNEYNYIDEQLDKYIGVIDPDKTISSIIINGISEYERVSPFETIAKKIVEKGNGEIKEIDNKKALVINSQDIYNVSSAWLDDAFELKKVYTITLKTKVIGVETSNSAYELRLRLKYTDGTYSEYNNISSYKEIDYTEHKIVSDGTKTIESIEFSSQANSPYKIAISIDDFIITPDVNPSYSNYKKIVSLGDSGHINIKFITKDNKVITKKVPLNYPLRSIKGTNVNDFLQITPTSLKIVRKIDTKELKDLNWLLYANSESTNGMVAYSVNAGLGRITQTYDVMSNYFKHYKATWIAESTEIGISATPHTSSPDYLYIKVPLSKFPTPASFTAWVNEQYNNDRPLEAQFQIATDIVTDLDPFTINLQNIKYVYTDSKLNTKISINY